QNEVPALKENREMKAEQEAARRRQIAADKAAGRQSAAAAKRNLAEMNKEGKEYSDDINAKAKAYTGLEARAEAEIAARRAAGGQLTPEVMGRLQMMIAAEIRRANPAMGKWEASN